MENAAHLRQTIRRCTAVITVTIALTGWILHPTDEGDFLILIVLGGLFYLASESFPLIPDSEISDETSTDSSTQGDNNENV
jgi:hypothetical protein